MIPYRIVRSRRRTLMAELLPDGTALVRAPARLPEREIERFLRERETEISRKSAAVCARVAPREESEYYLFGELRRHGEPVSPGWLMALYRRELAAFLAEELPKLAGAHGFSYRSVKVTAAEKRFGSCSGEDRLAFSYRLAAYPTACIRYVICHELCHTVEKNHSPRFWALVERVCPDYRERKRELARIYL